MAPAAPDRMKLARDEGSPAFAGVMEWTGDQPVGSPAPSRRTFRWATCPLSSRKDHRRSRSDATVSRVSNIVWSTGAWHRSAANRPASANTSESHGSPAPLPVFVSSLVAASARQVHGATGAFAPDCHQVHGLPKTLVVWITSDLRWSFAARTQRLNLHQADHRRFFLRRNRWSSAWVETWIIDASCVDRRSKRDRPTVGFTDPQVG